MRRGDACRRRAPTLRLLPESNGRAARRHSGRLRDSSGGKLLPEPQGQGSARPSFSSNSLPPRRILSPRFTWVSELKPFRRLELRSKAGEVVEIGRHCRLHGNSGMERVKGIEPSYSAWKAAALPLSYTRMFLLCQATPNFATFSSRAGDASCEIPKKAPISHLTARRRPTNRSARRSSIPAGVLRAASS